MVNVHHSAIVSPMARFGSNVTVGPFSVIYAGVTLNDNVVVRSHAVIGSPAEKTGYFTAQGLGVEVGENTHVSEGVTIHSGIIRKTTIGKRCLLLTKSHVGHCVTIGDDVTVSCSAMIGGESLVNDGANIALGAILHQKAHIGKWAMVGAGSVVIKNHMIMPGCIYAGVPAKKIKQNDIGLKRAGVTDQMLSDARINYVNATLGWTHR